VGIDRPEDSDAVDHRPDRPDHPTEPSDAALADPQQLAGLRRSYRARVDHAYDTARRGWTEVLPDLRATWDEITEKYGYTDHIGTARELPDGSWRGEGSLELNPAENAEVKREIARIRDVGEKDIVPRVVGVEDQDPSRSLAGYENRFKGDYRLREKVADQLQSPSDLTAGQALVAVPDAVRFTFQYAEPRYAPGVLVDVDRLKAQGFELIKLKNTWASDQYKGVNSQWLEPVSKVRFEVQFHTQASLEAKELSHKAYERLRGTTAEDDERDELKAFQSRVNAEVPIPPGVSTIEDYLREA
jgi:hypothetical protein